MKLSTWLYIAGAVVLAAEWGVYNAKIQNITVVQIVGKIDGIFGSSSGTYRGGLVLIGAGVVTQFAFGK